MAYANIKEFNVKYTPKAIARKLDDLAGNDSYDIKLQQFINDAAGFIDTHIAARYILPLVITDAMQETTGAALRRANLIVAEHDLAQRPPGKKSEKTEYDKIVDWLEGIREGVIDLPGASVKSASAGIIESNTPVFDPDSFASY